MGKIRGIFKNLFRKNKKYLLIGLPVLVILLYFILGHSKANGEIYIVTKGNVTQSVILSGQVMTSDRADLGFAASGRIGQIFIKNNQQVAQGQILAQLEIGDLLADLKIKQANSRVSDVDLEGAKEDLEKTTIQENTKVESAYRTLLSDDLELVPDSSTYEEVPPTTGGIYDGPEGQYKIIIDKENTTRQDLQIKTFNLEKTKELINEEGSTPLGTRGLYISFPDDELSAYEDTIWYLDIPNKTSSSYLSNYNAYNEAIKNRDLAIKKAESEYKRILIEAEGGQSSVAEAEIQKINAEIRKNTIYAPFKGIVTNIEKKVGESASVGERIISILGEDKLEVVLQVSELDVSRLTPGAEIKLSFDAFPGEDFKGILETVNSRETEVEGVPVYEAFVELSPDPRIKTGMSAKGTIILFSKENVLAIPNYLIQKNGDSNFVEVTLESGDVVEKEITLGLLGTDSMVEILSGLNEGDKIVFVSKE